MSVQSLPHHQYALQLLSDGILVLLSEVLAQQLINLLHTKRYQKQNGEWKFSVVITLVKILNNMSDPVLVLGQLVQLLSGRIRIFLYSSIMLQCMNPCLRAPGMQNHLLKQLSLSAHFLHMTAHYCWEWSHTQAPWGESGYETDCYMSTRNERRYKIMTSPRGLNVCGM